MMQDNYYNYCNHWETTIIATTEGLSHTVDKRHFTKGRNAEVFIQISFFVCFQYFTVLLLFFMKQFQKKAKETNFFEKKYSGLSCL